MQDKAIHIGGLINRSALPAWLRTGLDSGVLRWVEPAEVMSALESGGIPATWGELWWCYAAPWSTAGLNLSGSQPGMSNAWQPLHRRLLRIRARSGPKLRLLNVSIAPSLSAIRQALRQGHQPAAADDVALGSPGESRIKDVARSETEALEGMLAAVAEAESGSAHQQDQEVSIMLGHLHAWVSPESWDLVEALDAASWGCGTLPWGRDDLPKPTHQALLALTSRLVISRQTPTDERTIARLEEEAQAAATLYQQEVSRLKVDREACAAEADQARKALAETQAALDTARAEHKAALERAQADAQSQLEKSQAQAKSALGATQSQIKEAQEEGELLLLQLHQVQEELERMFLQGKDKDAAHQTALADAKAAADKATAAHQQEADKLKEDAAAKAAERDQARKTLVDTQAALEKVRAEHKAALEKAQADAKSQLEKSQAQAKSALEATQSQLKEAQEEGELLLLQLHQVQEELETHFLRGKDLEQQVQAVQRRYERLQRRYPDAVDIDALEVAETDASGAVPFVAWRLKGLAVQGHIWPELVLRTSLEPGGGVGFKLEAPDSSPLAHCMDGPLVPKGLAARQPEQVQRFRAVGATAWRTLIASCAAVDEALASVALIEHMPPDFDPVFWKQALGTTAPLLRALPPTFRHDGVRLKREQVNPDYEHLWLVFTEASHSDVRLGNFELRLAAAQVMPGLFSLRPKLEFPLRADNKPPFEGWFAESHDDFGPKLELRADLERKAFDTGVWAKLPKGTQSLLLSTIAALPGTLKGLADTNTLIARPWDDWYILIDGLIDVMRLRLAPPRTPPPPPPPPMPMPKASRKTARKSALKS